jgi:exonuclease SbcD
MSMSTTPANKKPLRICHMADVHLGYRRYNKLTKSGVNQREADVSLAFQEAITRIISLNPDVVVIAGDLFHTVRPSNAIVTMCFRQLRRLADEIDAPIIIVAGNHETPKRIDTGSVLQLFTEIKGVYVADADKEVFSFKELNLSVTCLPHAALLQRETLNLRADDRFQHNVLVVHGQVNDGWISDFGGAEIDLKSLAPHEWDYIALGHVHLHRTVGLNACYSGSLEHTATNIWSEANQPKGFLEIQLPGPKKVFHPLTSPREVLALEPLDVSGVEPSEIMELIRERVSSVAGGIEGKILRLQLSGMSRESYRHLDHKELRALRSQALNLTIDISFSATQTETANLNKPGVGLLKDQLLEFSKAWEVPGVSPQEIATTLESYVAQVEAKYEVA